MAQVKASRSPPEQVALNDSYDLVTYCRLTTDIMPGDACSPWAVIWARYTARGTPRPHLCCKVKCTFKSDSEHQKLCGLSTSHSRCFKGHLKWRPQHAPTRQEEVSRAWLATWTQPTSYTAAMKHIWHLTDSGPEKPTCGIDWVVSDPAETTVNAISKRSHPNTASIYNWWEFS